MRGFVDCLETDDPEEFESENPSLETDVIEEDAARIRSDTRLVVMRLLLYSLEQPTPNLAHFLLGYEYRKPASKTNLQDPGSYKGEQKSNLCASEGTSQMSKWFQCSKWIGWVFQQMHIDWFVGLQE